MDPRSDHARRLLGRVGLACAVGLAVFTGVLGARTYLSMAPEFGARTNSGPAGFADIVDVVKPAVFGVQTKVVDNSHDQRAPDEASPDRFFRQFGAPQRPPDAQETPRAPRVVTAQGSGFFVSADGYAVTNNHVVEGTTTAEIQTDDKKTYTAKVVGTDPASDLALLKVDGRDDFTYVKLADKPPRIGDWVLAVGNPFGLGGTVTAGIVSARERSVGTISYENLIQIDAPINKGDSGGPTFDLNGRVIGVNTMIFSPSGGSIGIAFAVPADTVKTVIPQLKDKGSVTRGWLGVQVQPVTREIADSLGLRQAQGALVAEPQADGPASKAGIVPGDVIVSVDGTAIKDPQGLTSNIGAKAPGKSVKLGVLREGGEKTVAVVLGELSAKRPTPAAGRDEQTTGRGASDLGWKLAPAGSVPAAGGQGVVVVDIDPSGLAAERGFEPGDVILQVGGKFVKTPDEFQNALSDARSEGKHTVLIRLRSGDTMRFVAIPTG
jgi:serine protease Do